MTDNEKINTIAVLYDIINQYSTELKPNMRQAMKKLTKEADNSLNRLIREFDKAHSATHQEGFGIVSDNLREVIECSLKEIV